LVKIKSDVGKLAHVSKTKWHTRNVHLE